MAEKVGTIYYDLDLDDAKYKSKSKAAGTDADNFGQRLQNASLSLAALGAIAGVALTNVVNYLDKAVDAAVKQQNALMGLSSVARGTGNSIDAATEAARKLSADGLMPLGDAAMGLKNLLASGFSLPQAVKLMEAFKDSAAFGRQGALDFGQAIVGATEGIKNGNSMLVDNAGVTKNLSNILVEAGFSAQDLSKATTNADVRMALFNGVLKETVNQTGDAARLAESFGGAQARLTTQVTNLQVALGTALQPILTKIMQVISPIVDKLMNWVKENPALVAAFSALAVALLALVAGLGIIGALVGAIMTLGTVGLVIGGVAAVIAVLGAALIYLETKFGAVSKAIDWVKGALAAVGDKLSEVFNSIMNNPAVKWVTNFLTTTFKQIWQDLQGIFKQLADSLKPVWDAFGKLFGIIGDFIQKHSKGLMQVLKYVGIALGAIVLAPLIAGFAALIAVIKIISVVLGFINRHFETIKKVVMAVIVVALAPLIAIVAAVVVAFKAVVWVVKTLWNVFTTVFNAIWTVVSFVFSGIMWLWTTILQPVFNAIIFIITSLFKIWWTIWSGIFQVAWTIISTIAQIIFVILQAVFNFIYNNFLLPIFNFWKAIFTAIWNVVSSVFTTVWNFLVGVLTGIWNFIVDVFNTVLGFVRWAWNGIKSAIIDPIAAAVRAVWDRIVGIKNAVVDGVNQAWNWLKGKFNDFVNAGRDLINGLVNGISGAKDAVVNKVKDIARGALDAVKSFFGIKSPSRVMAKMGDFLMQGLGNGISRAGDAVVDAAQTISERISDGMQDSMKNVSDGAKNVVGVYRGMYGQMNAMNMTQAATLNGTVSAIDQAQKEQNGGAIAQPPVSVTFAPNGIVARSRSEFRDIIADGIEAVNEELRARGYNEIGDGKVKGSSTV